MATGFLRHLIGMLLAPSDGNKPHEKRYHAGSSLRHSKGSGSFYRPRRKKRNTQKIKNRSWRRHHSKGKGKRHNRRERWEICFHGTPSARAAADIIRHGWVVGSGNAIGSGVYFARGSDQMARSYALPNGVIIKAKVYWGRKANWDNQKIRKQYVAWCQRRGRTQNGHTVSEWALANGYNSVVTKTYGVLVHPQYASSNWHWKTWRIRILSIHDAKTGKRVRV